MNKKYLPSKTVALLYSHVSTELDGIGMYIYTFVISLSEIGTGEAERGKRLKNLEKIWEAAAPIVGISCRYLPFSTFASGGPFKDFPFHESLMISDENVTLKTSGAYQVHIDRFDPYTPNTYLYS